MEIANDSLKITFDGQVVGGNVYIRLREASAANLGPDPFLFHDEAVVKGQDPWFQPHRITARVLTAMFHDIPNFWTVAEQMAALIMSRADQIGMVVRNQRPRGRWFEEFEPEQTFTTGTREIVPQDIYVFMNMTGDDNRLHYDDFFAQQFGFPGRIAHGELIKSIATGLLWQTRILEGTIVAYRSIEDWKFTKPVLPGDTIHAIARVRETKAYPRVKNGSVKFYVEVVNQKGEVVQSGHLVMLMRMKPPDETQPEPTPKPEKEGV